MKIVINKAYGGWHVSKDFCQHYNIPYKEQYGFCYPEENITKKDQRLIEYIKKFGSKKASGQFSNLVVVNIPKGKAYRIEEYDGYEYIEYRDEIEWEIAED